MASKWATTAQSHAADETPALSLLASPQPGSVPHADGLPVASPARCQAWILGAHGGAGESTLATLLGVNDAEHAWHPGETSLAPHAVCFRTNAAGIEAARRALTQWASGDVPGVRLVGLIAVADVPGRSSKWLRRELEKLAGASPAFWEVRFVRELREHPNDMEALASATHKMASSLAPEFER